MMSESSVDGERMLYPGFATKANRIMIEDMLGIKKGDRLLITTSPSVPWELADSVREYAEGIGVKTRILSVGRMYGEPPSEAITSLARESDGIYNLGGGGWDQKKIVEAKVPQILVGGAPGIDESLVRTVVNVDPEEMRREGWKIADAFTEANHVRITSRLGTDYTEDISGIVGEALSGYASDPRGTPWEYVPGSCPGIVELRDKYAANGRLVFDGQLGDRGTTNPEPITVIVRNSKILDIQGGPEAEKLKQRIHDYLEKAENKDDFYFPVEWGIGTNPNATVVAPNGRRYLEWERLRGGIHMGFGSIQPYPVFHEGKLINPEWEPAKFHSDLLMLYPTVHLDDKLIVKDGIIQKF